MTTFLPETVATCNKRTRGTLWLHAREITTLAAAAARELCMRDNNTWMGRPIPDMDRHELAAALKAALTLLRSLPSASFLRSDIDVRETSTGTVVGRAFKWAFIPAGQLWSDEDRRDVQSRLDEFAARHGLQGATVRFGSDRLEVEVPRRLQIEQVVALQKWLDTERETLDVSQVP
jgi:hypothetical protein